jgi:hypothetical protein
MITPTSWDVHEEISFEEWIAQGRKFGLIGRAAGWWIGDWLRFGNAKYGERYTRAARITGYDTQTLTNMVYVATSIATCRRHEKLSWSHHAEVAALDEEAQERWLSWAEKEGMSVRSLREMICHERRALTTATSPIREAAVGHELTSVAGRAPSSSPDLPLKSVEAVVCPSCGHSLPADARSA